MANLVDMKRTKSERKAANKPVSLGASKYPYGLSITLSSEELDKLGIKTLPKVGSKIHLQAQAHVVSVSQNSSEGSTGENRHVELELRKLGVDQKGSGPKSEDAMKQGMQSAMNKALGGKDADSDDDGDGGADTDDDGD